MSLFYYFYAQIQAGYIFLMALSDNVLWPVCLFVVLLCRNALVADRFASWMDKFRYNFEFDYKFIVRIGRNIDI
jgi:cell division protein FtsW (lipid II flippase)